MKKALSLILAVIMVVSLMPTAAISVFAEESSVKQDAAESAIPDGAIAIGSAEELLAIDETEETDGGKYYYLTQNIDLGTGEGESYAVSTYNAPQITLKNSTLDGRGYSIIGFKLTGNGAENKDVSLFAMTGEVTVKSLTFGAESERIEFDVNDTWNTFSVVMANVPTGTECTMENVVVYTDMTSNGNGNGRYLGATVGKVDGKLSLTECEVYGTVTDKSDSDPRGCGGFVGSCTGAAELSFKDCVNNAAISGYKKLGGFIGYASAANLSFNGCVNNGNVSAGDALAGGFIGQFYDNTATANNISVVNCANEGAVSGTNAIGGFVGEWNSKAKTTKGTLKVEGFNQSGAVKATAGNAGGIIGNFMANDDFTVNNLKSDNTGSVEATNYAGGIFGYASDVPSGVKVTVDGGSSANSVKSAGNHAGGVVGYAAVQVIYTISNYTNKGTVTTTVASMNAGGLFGQLKTTKALKIENFTNMGTIVSKNNGAAMFGQLEPGAAVEILNCRNTATVTAESGNAGMIVGWGSGTYAFTVKNCVNNGAMNGATRAGGFFGGMTSGALTMENCKNFATVTGNGNNAGGFAGDYTVKSGESNISNIVNYGNVTSKSGNAGGFAGYTNITGTMTIDGFLNAGNISGTAKRGGAITGNHGGTADYVIKNAINLGDTYSAWDIGAFGWIDGASSVTIDGCVNAGKIGKNIAAIAGVKDGISTSFGETSKNAYLASTLPDGKSTNGAEALADLDAVLAMLNTESYTDVWGAFKAGNVDENDKATSIVQANPVAYGLQMGSVYTDDEGVERTSIRFVGTIKNTLRYQKLGYSISFNDGEASDYGCEYVYEKILAGLGGQQIEYTATELGGTYIFAQTLKGIKTNGTVSITVRPYAIDTDGTEYRDTEGFTVVIVNGAVESIVKA